MSGGNGIPWIDLLEAWAPQVGLTATVAMTETNKVARRALRAHFPVWLNNQARRMGHPRPFWNISKSGPGQWRCVMQFGCERTVVGVADTPDPVLSMMCAYNQARSYFPT